MVLVYIHSNLFIFFFFFQAEDGIRDYKVLEFRRVLFRSLRARMVGTLRDRGIFHDVVIERAFDQVPREAFLPGVAIEQVYSGDMIPTKHDTSGSLVSSSSEVGVMASMIEMCELAPGHRVLEIGAGTGYNAAILATVVGERGEVTTVDI